MAKPRRVIPTLFGGDRSTANAAFCGLVVASLYAPALSAAPDPPQPARGGEVPAQHVLHLAYDFAVQRRDVDTAVEIYGLLSSSEHDAAGTWEDLADACVAGAACDRHFEHVLRRCLQMNPTRHDLAAVLADWLAKGGAVDEALSLLDALTEHSPLDADLWESWTEILRHRVLPGAAQQFLVARADRHHDNAKVQVRILEELWHNGAARASDALVEGRLQAALTRFAGNADVWALWGLWRLERDDLPGAREALRVAMKNLSLSKHRSESPRVELLARDVRITETETELNFYQEAQWLFFERDLEPSYDY